MDGEKTARAINYHASRYNAIQVCTIIKCDQLHGLIYHIQPLQLKKRNSSIALTSVGLI